MGFVKHIGPAVLLACALAPGLWGAEYAVLQTGFRLRAERHEAMGPVTRLYLPGGGWVDVKTEEVAYFEKEEFIPRPPTPDPQPSSLDSIIQAAGEKHGLDADLIKSVIAAESAGDPQAVSPKGAAGLMQLMPGTARRLGVKNVFDPVENVEGGTAYLRYLLGQFGNDLSLALAAYNAGPEKVTTFRGLPPYRETYSYVSRVIRLFNQKKLAGNK